MALHGLVDLPELPESPPEIDLVTPAMLARPKAREISVGMDDVYAFVDDSGDPR